MTHTNDNLVLISGVSGTGKSASLCNLRNPDKVLYLNTENGKKLPFQSKFIKGPEGKAGFVITDPYQVQEAFDAAEGLGAETIIVDTLTFLMDMYENLYVTDAADTRKAWGNYQQYFKDLMQNYVTTAKANVIFTAHTLATYDETNKALESKVPVKGSLKNQGIEAFFSIVVSCKKMKLKELEKYKSKLLNITPEDELVGYKHVFQTKPTASSLVERIRSPLGMFDISETFMDNDAQLLLDRIHEYYA